MASLRKIVSGGQTGVDRAALDVAIRFGVSHGGWCPAGRKSEKGRIPGRYELIETPTAVYAQRTEWNVRDSDGTVIFSLSDRPRGGSRRTAELALRYGRPCLHLSAARPEIDPVPALLDFIRRCGIRILNVAGPRKSEEPGASLFAKRVLTGVLRHHGKPTSNSPFRPDSKTQRRP